MDTGQSRGPARGVGPRTRRAVQAGVAVARAPARTGAAPGRALSPSSRVLRGYSVPSPPRAPDLRWVPGALLSGARRSPPRFPRPRREHQAEPGPRERVQDRWVPHAPWRAPAGGPRHLCAVCPAPARAQGPACPSPSPPLPHPLQGLWWRPQLSGLLACSLGWEQSACLKPLSGSGGPVGMSLRRAYS